MGRNIRLIALHNFFTDLRFHSAVLILYFTGITGSYALGMSLFSAVFITAAVFEVPTGIYSDKIGRRKTLIWGSYFAVLSAIFYALGGSYSILLVGAVAEGLSRAFYSGNNNALLYDSLQSENKHRSYSEILGKTSSLFQVALATGAVLGSIGASFSYPFIMWASVVPQLLCLIIAFQIIEPHLHSKKEEGNIYLHLKSSLQLLFTHPKLRLIALQDVFSFGINEATFQFRSVFIVTIWPLWAVGVAKFLSFALASVSFWFSGRIIAKFGEIKSILFARIFGRVIGFFSYGFPGVFSPLFLSSTSLFFGTVTVASDSFTQKLLTPKERATVPSLTSFFGSIFISIFSILLGYLADVTTPARSLLAAEIMSAFILIFVIRLNKISHSSETL
jgi:MFS family permease